MIKVIHLITGLSTGGAEMMLYKLLSNMDRSRFENIVVSMLDLGTIGKEIQNTGIRVYTLNLKKNYKAIGGVIKLINILRIEKPEIIQTWLQHADILGLIMKVFYPNADLVWNIRNTYDQVIENSLSEKVLVRIGAIFSPIPSAIIVNSQCGMNSFTSAGYKPKKWCLIPNGFEMEKFRITPLPKKNVYKSEYGYASDSRIICMVGRYSKVKGYMVALEAANILLNMRHYNNIVFIMIGKGLDLNNIDLISKINSLKLNSNIKLFGERLDVNEFLKITDIFLSASLSEGFPNVIGEAMASGLPVVATDVGDCGSIIDCCGNIVKCNDPFVLANALEQYLKLSDEELYVIGQKARDRVEKNYDIRNIALEYENLYDRF